MLLYCILDKWLCGKLPYHEALDFQDELEREQAERMSPSKEYENCQDLFFWRHDGVYQPLLVSAEYGWQEKGYASSCLVRGLLALENMARRGKILRRPQKLPKSIFRRAAPRMISRSAASLQKPAGTIALGIIRMRKGLSPGS